MAPVGDNRQCLGTRSGSSFSSCKKLLPVELRSVIRLRPLCKKERDEHVVVEIPRSNNNRSENSPHDPAHNISSILLHPLPRSENATPNSGAPPFLSPESNRTNNNQEMEFHFDQAFCESSTQDSDVFAKIGRPTSLSAMEALFSKGATIKTHVTITVGTAGSGKTYTTLGSRNQSLKRKVPADGMIPRMADSLFGQYQRLSSMKKNESIIETRFFAVKISALQVNQPKNPRTSSGEAGTLHDLLQHASRASPKAQQRFSFERINQTSKSTTLGGASPSERGFGSLGSIDKALYIDQNPLTHDFRVANAHVQQCRSSEEARETLQDVIVGIRKASRRRHECHILIQLQPVLVDEKTGETARSGGRIAFLNMADFENRSISRPRNRFVSTRLKDNLPNRCDAHAAVIHCLRSILFNELVRQGKNPTLTEFDAMNEVSMEAQTPKSLNRKPTVRQVPYLQHKITMLLQPFFSSNQSDRTTVTMILAASPGHRDYTEKKELMAEIESLWAPFHRACVNATTGIDDAPQKATTKYRQTTGKSFRRTRKSECHVEDENSGACRPLPAHVVQRKRRHPEPVNPPIAQCCSDSTDDFSLPPPIAPPALSLAPAHGLIRQASAPVEDEAVLKDDIYDKIVIPMERTPISDFPGVVMTSVANCISTTEDSSSPSSASNPNSDSDESSPRWLPKAQSDPKRASPTIPRGSANLRERSTYQPVSKKSTKSAQSNQTNSKADRYNKTKPEVITSDQLGKKKKWSRTVEITTTTVESSGGPVSPVSPNDPVISPASAELAETDVSEVQGVNSSRSLQHEMENLKRQNERLQEQLKKLKVLNPSKSVSWRDGLNGLAGEFDDDCVDNDEVPPNKPATYSTTKNKTATKTMDSRSLKERMAKLNSPPMDRKDDAGLRHHQITFPSLSLTVGGGSTITNGGFQLRNPQVPGVDNSHWNHL